MKFRFLHRFTAKSPEGDHVWTLGIRIGYWPCLRAPFVQVALGCHLLDFWYGKPSYYE